MYITEFIFISCVALCFYVYFGYPLLLLMALAKALTTLLNDKELARRLSNQRRELSKTRHSWEQVFSQILAVFIKDMMMFIEGYKYVYDGFLVLAFCRSDYL